MLATIDKHAYTLVEKQPYLQPNKCANTLLDMDLSERIKAARKHAGLTQRQLAEAARVEQPLISQLENKKTLKTAHIAQIAKACRVSAIWLASGEGSMLPNQVQRELVQRLSCALQIHGHDDDAFQDLYGCTRTQALAWSMHDLPTDPDSIAKIQSMPLLPSGTTQPQKIEPNAELIGMMSPWDQSTPLHDDEVAIPLYKEVEMAAGSGATQVIESPGRLLRFAKSTLREAGVLEQNAACATIKGTSMERLIMDGATIGIDRGATHIEDGEIYAFDHDGMLRVKYLYRMPGGGLRIRSENSEEYPDEYLSPEQASSLRILGWVFWWSTVRRKRGLSLAK